MTLANVAEVAARSTVQAEPSHGFVAWQALVDGCAPKSSNDPAFELQPIFATPKNARTQRKLMETLSACSLKVAEYKHAPVQSD